MASTRAFVYVVCGAASHVRAVHRSIEYLRPRTAYPIVVVTDARRNEVSVEHDTVLDIETPRRFDDHQASIFLKTSLHRILPPERDHVYLDSDIIAAHAGVDAIFDHQYGPVTFARDLTHLESRVAIFSPWAVRCGCPTAEGHACSHLSDAIHETFGVRVPDDWMHWNGGVFLFGRDAAPFMETWHRLTLQIFEDPYWKTRDQGTLVATVWTLGIERQRCLPHTFDFIVDDNNADLCFDRETGYSLHPSIPGIHPTFLHLYHADLARPGWSLERDVEAVLDTQMRARRNGPGEAVCQRLALTAIGKRLARRPFARAQPERPGVGSHAHEAAARDAVPHRAAGTGSRRRSRVVVAVPRWTVGDGCAYADTLVRGLRGRGIDAQVLLTGRDSEPATETLPRTADVPVVELPASMRASWGTRWGTLVRYLEERTPCIYLPLDDWHHSNVSPHLSDRVGIVGIALSDDPLYADQFERLGRYWNAIVAPSASIASRLAEQQPELSDRILRISPGALVPSDPPARENRAGGPLRLVYHGRVSQHEQRVFDLPRIADALVARGVPVELTVIGDGPDLEPWRAAGARLLELGALRYVGVLSQSQAHEELKRHDACLLTAEADGVPLAVIEAMGCGCVPVVSETPGMAELIVEDDAGYRVPVGNVQAFCDRLELLYQEPERRLRMAGAARRAVIDRGFRAEDMVEAYVELFERIEWRAANRGFTRPKGLLRKPPYQVAGTAVFPEHYVRGVDNVGLFPSYREDYDDYRTAVGEPRTGALPAWRPDLVNEYPVIMAAPAAPDAVADRLITCLAQGLRRIPQPAYVLVAPGSKAPFPPGHFGDDVPLVATPTAGPAPGRPRGRALVEHLDRHAPCLYLPGDQWLHLRVCPRLSEQVGVVMRIDRLSARSLARVARMGRYWNAVVAGSTAIADRIVNADAALAPRVVTIPRAVDIPERLAKRPLVWDAPLKVACWRDARVSGQLEGDLPHILDALAGAQLPIDVENLLDPCDPLLQRCDVLLVTTDTEDARTCLLHAMGRGCVAVVARGHGTFADLVKDGESGYVVPDGDIRGFVARLSALQSHAALRRGLAARAFQTVACGGYRSEDVLASYMMLFERVLRDIEFGLYRRPPFSSSAAAPIAPSAPASFRPAPPDRSR